MYQNLDVRSRQGSRTAGGARRNSLADPALPAAQRLAYPVAVAVAVFTFVLLQLLDHLTGGNGADFKAVLRGASDLAGGRDLYAPALSFLGGGHLRDILSMQVTPYVYPPLLAVAMRPFTLLPPGAALVLWDAVNVTGLAILFVLVVRLSAATSFRQLVLVSVLYGFFPLNMSLGTGQVDISITLLALLSYLLYRSGHLRRAGVLLAVIALIKPTIGALVLFYICRRAWPVVIAFALAVAMGIVASLAAVGGKVLWEYREVAGGWANSFGVLPLNQSLHGFVARFLSPGRDVPPSGTLGTLSLWVEGALLAVAAALIWRLLRRGEPEELRRGALQFYAAFSILLLGIPFTENIHLSWLLPGVGLLLILIAQQPTWRPWQVLAIVSYLVLALPFAELIGWRAGSDVLGRLGSSAECYGLLGLSAALCLAAFSSDVVWTDSRPALTILRARLAAPRDDARRAAARALPLPGANRAAGRPL